MAVTPGPDVAKRSVLLPNNGMAGSSGSSIFTGDGFVYVANTGGGSNVRNTLWRFPITNGRMADVPDETVQPYPSRLADATHLEMAIGVDGQGRVQVAEQRKQAWRVLRSSVINGTAGMNAVPDPLNLPAALYGYALMERHEDGLYMRLQDREPTVPVLRMFKWNDTTEQWTLFGGAPLFAFPDSGAGGIYNAQIEVRGSTVWAVASHIVSTGTRTAGAFRAWYAIRSTDGGATWHKPSTGAAVTLPATETTADFIARPTLGNAVGDKDVVSVTLDADGTFHYAGAWQNAAAGDTTTNLWYGKFVPGTGWVHERLATEAHYGTASVGRRGNKLFIIAPTQDRSVADPAPRKVWLYVSADKGANWTRHLLDQQATARVSEGLLDSRSVAVSGRMRYYPFFHNEPARAEVWEFDLPGDAPVTVRIGGVARTSKLNRGGVARTYAVRRPAA